jgi:hypothetical protein
MGCSYVLVTALSRYAIYGIVSCDFTKVRAHDWFSKLLDRNGDFSRLGRSHMTAAFSGTEFELARSRNLESE